MEVLDGRVDWKAGYGNDPELQVLVDEIPTDIEFDAYEQSSGTVYFGSKDGYCRYLYHDPSNTSGFGGSSFKLLMSDGTEKTIKGPWASRAGAMNDLGLGPCVDVRMTTNENAWEQNTSLTFGTITVEKARKAAAFADVHLIGVEKYDSKEETYVIEEEYPPNWVKIDGDDHPVRFDHKSDRQTMIEVSVKKNEHDVTFHKAALVVNGDEVETTDWTPKLDSAVIPLMEQYDSNRTYSTVNR